MTRAHPNFILLPGLGYRSSVLTAMQSLLTPYPTQCVDLPVIDRPFAIDHQTALVSQLRKGSILIGWSLGGLVAIELCKNFPGHFSKLVLLASSPKFIATDNWPGIDAVNFENFAASIHQNSSQTFDMFQKLVCFPTASIKLKHYLSGHTSTHHDSILYYVNYLIRRDLRTSFASLTQPAIAIAGDQDAVLQASPVTTHIIQGAGHALFHTHAELVCSIITQFAECAHD